MASLLWVAVGTAAPAAGQSSVVGTVFDSLNTHRPLSNAVVVLVERSRYATTDSMGRFRFDNVPAGRYRLGILHAVLDSFDLAAPPRPIDVADSGTTVVELATPSAESAYLHGCAIRLSEVANKADVVAYLRISTACAKLARVPPSRPPHSFELTT
ncbi:MAG: carboxypeptidase-like regulatory domain-containing protein [Gemmatimonadaceae bacterium]